jgi:hypothetical protein
MQSNRAISPMISTSRVEKPSGLSVPALKCRSTRFSNAYNSDSPADFTFSSRCKNVSVSSWICFVIVSLVGFKRPIRGFGLIVFFSMADLIATIGEHRMPFSGYFTFDAVEGLLVNFD